MVKKGNITAVSSDQEEDVEFDIASNKDEDVEWNRADSPFVFDQLIRDPKKDDFVLIEFKIEKNIKPVYYTGRDNGPQWSIVLSWWLWISECYLSRIWVVDESAADPRRGGALDVRERTAGSWERIR
ncbi:hypothetical protein FQA39_LY15659 [Lamprigera yunnana]|nr:hypothetical protein FQA39_LY15659 [Lamprigera yunnana]